MTVIADYQRRTMHRPTCVRCMEMAARELSAQGLKAADIAQALGVSAAAVTQLLQESRSA